MTIAPPGPRGIGCRSRRDGRWLLDAVIGCVATDGQALAGPVELVVRDGVIEVLRPASGGCDGGVGDGPGRSGLVLVPLFVNAHDHGRGAGNVLAGIPDGPLEPWIESLRDLAPPASQEELVGDGCRAMLASGIGATVICVNPRSADVTAEVEAAARAALGCGVRAAIVFPIADAMESLPGRRRDATGWSADEVERRLGVIEDLAESIADPRIDVQLGPVGPQWVSEATLRAVGRHARCTGRRVHMHLLESRAQRAWADATYHEGIVEFLDSVQLAGPHVCFAHGTNLRPRELDALGERDCVLALNASSNLRLCSGVPPVSSAWNTGLSVGAGLDGLALGDDGDYWNELRLVRGLAQAQSGERLDAASLLDRLTAGGHRSLGSCAPAAPAVGELADFQLIDLSSHAHLLARADWAVADVAIAAGRPERVQEVWVAGVQVLARDRAQSLQPGVAP